MIPVEKQNKFSVSYRLEWDAVDSTEHHIMTFEADHNSDLLPRAAYEAMAQGLRSSDATFSNVTLTRIENVEINVPF